jgi:hypothetical protein
MLIATPPPPHPDPRGVLCKQVKSYTFWLRPTKLLYYALYFYRVEGKPKENKRKNRCLPKTYTRRLSLTYLL